MSRGDSHTPKVFVSYSHKDERWKVRLMTHLKVIQGEIGFDLWDDRRIAAGNDWHAEIRRSIESADLALLLISAHYLTSEFILREEVPRFLARQEREGLRIIPVILEPCAWQKVTWLGRIQALPTDGRPLSQPGRRHQIEAELTTIALAVYDHLKALARGISSPTRMTLPQLDAPSLSTVRDLLKTADGQRQSGRYAESRNTLEQAVMLLSQLRMNRPEVLDYRVRLASVYNVLGNLQRRLNGAQEATTCYHQALDLQEKLIEEFPANVEYQNDTARTLHNLGTVLWDLERFPEAETRFRKAIRIRQSLIHECPDHGHFRLFVYELAGSYRFLGLVLQSQSLSEEAEIAFRDALQSLERLSMDASAPPGTIHETACAYMNLAKLLADAGSARLEEAQGAYSKALQFHQVSVATFPENPEYRSDLAAALGGIARVARGQRQLRLARERIDEAIIHGLWVAENCHPPVPKWLTNLRQDYKFLIAVLLESAEYTTAANTAMQVPRILRNTPTECVDIAGFFATCVGEWVNRDVPSAQRLSSARQFEDQAVRLFRVALATGAIQPAALRTDDRLDALRARPDFQELLIDPDANG